MSATSHQKRGTEQVKEEIQSFIRAGYPVLFLYTPEERRALRILRSIAEDENYQLYTHDLCGGLRCERGEDEYLISEQQQENRAELPRLFSYIKTNVAASKGRKILVLRNPQVAFQQDPWLIHRFKNFVESLCEKDAEIYFVIVSSTLTVWQELEKEMVVIDLPYPTREEIRHLLESHEDVKAIAPKKQIRDRVVEALNGLTEEEIKHLINYCIQDDGELTDSDIKKINEQKKQIAKKSGALEFVDSDINIGDIGGLDCLKEWIEQKKKIFERIEEASENGVDMPKGILLAGMPGCGKSLAAKAIASTLGMPLLRLDMGAVMGPYLGQSEENLRKAIKLAEAVAPSVLWIDELEKALAGSKGDAGGGTSETSGRILGTILTWMQEKTAPVFIIATANNVAGVPPEFMRKGRFDENFFVDLPSPAEREKILEIHLKKRKQGDALTGSEIKEIAKGCEGFSGADLEAVVKEEIERVFLNGEGNVQAEKFKKAVKEFFPISKMMGDELKSLKEKLDKFHFKPATKK